ncbi:SDR family NAD(P)-dependent oxidoreductase [Amycolatopsis sp. cmx-11-12]|uniref:SDR family NAD(P)-dependent oxidoreductase n=1 Tax=Amycolatopsis sp. cmx-11-12 TaxID=2785795 RepID=UPI003917B92C
MNWRDRPMSSPRELLPDLTGCNIVVTGTTSGLGLALSGALAAAGARILMTVRDAERGAAAVDQVRAGIDGTGSAEPVLLDLADLSSVRAAVERGLAAPAGPGRGRRQCRTIPAWESVNPTNTPIANSGTRVFMSPSVMTSRIAAVTARNPTP